MGTMFITKQFHTQVIWNWVGDKVNSMHSFDTFGYCRLCQKCVDDVRHEAHFEWNRDRDEVGSMNTFDSFGDCHLCQKSVDDVRHDVLDGDFSWSFDTICYKSASPNVSKVRRRSSWRYLLTQAALAICVKSPWTNSWRTFFHDTFDSDGVPYVREWSVLRCSHATARTGKYQKAC